jgi:hypothetical protein
MSYPRCYKLGGCSHALTAFDADDAEGKFGNGLCGGALYEFGELGRFVDGLFIAAARTVAFGDPPPVWLPEEPDLSERFDDAVIGAKGLRKRRTRARRPEDQRKWIELRRRDQG